MTAPRDLPRQHKITGVCHKPDVHANPDSQSVRKCVSIVPTGLADELLIVDRERAVVEGVLERLVHNSQVGEVVCKRGAFRVGETDARQIAEASQSYPRTRRCPTTGTVGGPACRKGSCSLDAQARARRTQREGC